eukprot:6266994-Alexandrium_andersonii.AAC.1
MTMQRRDSGASGRPDAQPEGGRKRPWCARRCRTRSPGRALGWRPRRTGRGRALHSRCSCRSR